MAIIGALIKKAIELRKTFETDSPPIVAQRQQLNQLLTKARNTSFGIYYGFDEMLKQPDFVKAFQEHLPIHDYNTINERWWQQQQLVPNITWPGKPDHFALSSGTTGKKSKRIPVTDDMLQCFRDVSLAQVSSLVNFDLPPDLFERKILALGSSTDLTRNKEGFWEGEISGINASNAPDWFDYFYRPGKEIASIDAWDQRVKAIVEAAPDWDIGALAGIPSWILMMLRAVVDHHQLKNIHEIWPGLSIYTTGGVAFEPFRESFLQIFGKEVAIMDTYLASEGYFAFNARPGTNAMKLAFSEGIFYEFIPFDESGFDASGQLLSQPKVLTIDQVEEDQDYALIISTPAGAWRYIIGDTIRFTDLRQMELLITGRTKYFLNVVGSQLSEEKLNTAIQGLSEAFGITINEFAVAALKDDEGQYYHQWVLAASEQVDEAKLTEKLDALLSEANKNYRVARNKALKDIRLTCVDKSTIYAWLEENGKKGGQIKFPKVMKSEKMRDLLGYL